jgi:cytochrome P450
MPAAIAREPHRFVDDIRREQGDVFEVVGNTIGGVHFPTLVPMDPAQPSFMVTGYSTVHAVVMNQGAFFQNHAHNMDLLMGEGQIAGLNPPNHRQLRTLFFQAFNRQSVDHLQLSAIQPLMRGLLCDMATRERTDIVRDFTCRVPTYLMCEIFALPPERCNEFAQLVSDLMNFGSSWANAMAASARLETLFLELIETRKRHPGDDLISHMLAEELEGRRLTATEMMSFCRALVPAGVETTTRALSTLLTAVLSEPGLWTRLGEQRELIPYAVDEAMRWNSPAQMIPKRTTAAIEVGGTSLPAHANLYIYLGQANRDGARWPDPHRYRAERERKPHLAFSMGAHMCLGNQLARREMQDALSLMLDRFPALRLDPGCAPPSIVGIQHRSADRIDVVLH